MNVSCGDDLLLNVESYPSLFSMRLINKSKETLN